MLKVTCEGTEGPSIPPLGYCKGKGWLGRRVLKVTRRLRASHASRYIRPGKRLLDIGCGDGYFLRRICSQFEECYGLDRLVGDEVRSELDFPDEWFDCVTMLAVIEHIPQPEETLREIHRVLRPGGTLVLTTPKQSSEGILRLYAPDVEDEHDTYYDAESIKALAGELFELTAHHTFIVGLNQAFQLTKRLDPAGPPAQS